MFQNRNEGNSARSGRWQSVATAHKLTDDGFSLVAAFAWADDGVGGGTDDEVAAEGCW